MSDKYPVMEIFGPTIQGEGPMCGRKTFFVRFGGCGYRCNWCDTMFAVKPALVKEGRTMMSGGEILIRLIDLGMRTGDWVTFSGGDPVMHDLTSLVQALHIAESKVQVETQGQLWKDWLSIADMVVVSPKAPSSLMHDKYDPEMIEQYTYNCNNLHMKIVCFNGLDVAWAVLRHKEWPDIPMYISAGTPQGKDDINTTQDVLINLTNLAEHILKNVPALHDATILPQMHVLMWGTKQGV